MAVFDRSKVKDDNFVLMPEGEQNLTVKELDADKCILENATGETVWVKIFDNETILNLMYTFGVEKEGDLIGKSKVLKVSHNDRDGKTYANASIDFAPIPLGEHIFSIKKVEDKKTMSGKDMTVLTFEKEDGRLLFHNIVEGEWFNSNIARVIDAFNLEDPKPNETISYVNWIGKKARISVKHDIYQDKPKAAVHFFKPLTENTKAAKAEQIAVAESEDTTIDNIDDDIPF